MFGNASTIGPKSAAFPRQCGHTYKSRKSRNIKIRAHSTEKKKVVQKSVVLARKNNMHQLKSQPFPRKTVSGFPPKVSTDFLENLEGDPPKSSTFQHIFRQSSWTPWHLRDPSFISSSPLEKSRGNPWSTFWIPMGYKRRRLTSFLAKNVFEN